MAATDLDITLPGESSVDDFTAAGWKLEDFPELKDFLQPATAVPASALESLVVQPTKSLHNSVGASVNKTTVTSSGTSDLCLHSTSTGLPHTTSSVTCSQPATSAQCVQKYDVAQNKASLPTAKLTTTASTGQDHANPMFFKLQSALKTECDSTSLPYTLMGAVKPDPDALPPMPLSVRTNQVQMRFLRLQTGYCKKVTELYSFYCVQAADIEGDRYKALINASMSPWQYHGINCYYDHLHHELISRIEKSVALLESSKSPPAMKRSPPTSSSRRRTSSSFPVQDPSAEPAPESRPKSSLTGPMTSVAVQIMTNWYDRNEEHPYPSYDTCEVMARAGNITVEQVKKWFANHRNRSGNTKSLQDIAKRRISSKVPGYKRPRTDCSDFLMAANKKSRE